MNDRDPEVLLTVSRSVLLWSGVRMRKRMRRIETQLQKMQKKISLLHMQKPRRLMTELNAKTQGENRASRCDALNVRMRFAEPTRAPDAVPKSEKPTNFGGG
jgi:hypothetical protein